MESEPGASSAAPDSNAAPVTPTKRQAHASSERLSKRVQLVSGQFDDGAVMPALGGSISGDFDPFVSSSDLLRPLRDGFDESDMPQAVLVDSAFCAAVESGDENVGMHKKRKGKGKVKVCPLLPDTIWRRIFELLYDSYSQGGYSLPVLE